MLSLLEMGLVSYACWSSVIELGLLELMLVS